MERKRNMQFKRKRYSSLLTILILGTFLLNSFPVRGQDLVSTSEDLTNGSSVFVFRQSRKAPQARSSSKSKTVSQRTSAQRTESRKKIQEQVAANQKSRPHATKVNSPVPPTTKVANTASREQAAKVLAGAAEMFLEQNDLDKSIDYFKKAAELDPKNAAAKPGLSEAYIRKGNKTLDDGHPETAVYYFEEAAKANPNNAGAYAGLGECYDAAGNNDKAQVGYEKALALDPTLTELYTPLGIIYYQKGEIAKSEEYLIKSRAIRPDDPDTELFYGLILSRQNRNDEAIAAFKRSITKTSTPEAHLYLGEAYDRADRDKEAITEYQEAIRLNPRYVEAYYNLGVAYYNREKYLDAVAAYQEAIKYKNDYAEAHANLAETFRQLGSAETNAVKKKEWFGKAIGEYSIAVAFLKDDTELYSSYGYTLGRLGRWTQSIDALKKAITPRSDAIDYSNLGWAYYNGSQEDAKLRQDAASKQKLQEARAALEKAVSLDSKFQAAYLNLGITQNDLGDYAAAVISLQAALKLHKNWTFALNELGIAFRKLNRLGEAVEQFKKATDTDSNFAAGYYNLAESEYRRGHTKEAKKAQDKLRKLNPNLARQLDVIFSGAVLTEVQNQVQQNNPLTKIPKPKLP
jgi:tetratricopeptide (TPR) repeat protein